VQLVARKNHKKTLQAIFLALISDWISVFYIKICLQLTLSNWQQHFMY